MSALPPQPVRTLACFVSAPRHELFRRLADVENLPRWAEALCSALELNRGRWLAYTVTGEAFVEIEANEHCGTIDLRWGDEHRGVRLLPLRVVSFPGGRTLITAVCCPAPWQDDLAFEREVAALARSLELLAVEACDGRENCRRAG